MKLDTDQLERPCDLGVVLFWGERKGFGRYGYLVPYQREAGIKVIYFDQASLIDSSEPIAEGSMVHYDVQEENLGSRIKAVSVEVEQFTTHVPQLDFIEWDIMSFPVLKPSDPVGAHLLRGLSPELKGMLERYQQGDRVEKQLDLLQSSQQLYKELRWRLNFLRTIGPEPHEDRAPSHTNSHK